jgi:hypothetical protein
VPLEFVASQLGYASAAPCGKLIVDAGGVLSDDGSQFDTKASTGRIKLIRELTAEEAAQAALVEVQQAGGGGAGDDGNGYGDADGGAEEEGDSEDEADVVEGDDDSDNMDVMDGGS